MAIPIGTGMVISAGVSALGSAIKGKEGQEPVQSPTARNWAREMARMYPELKGLTLPKIAPEAMELISMLMKAGLPPEMIKALGLGAEQEYGTALAGMPQGVGPIALGKMRAGVMGRLGQTKAMMGFEGMKTGLAMVPQISELMMQPQKYGAAEQQRRWADISTMFQTTPGATYLKGKERGYGIPGFGTSLRGTPGYESPATGWNPSVARY